jgi:hypothetical protein
MILVVAVVVRQDQAGSGETVVQLVQPQVMAVAVAVAQVAPRRPLEATEPQQPAVMVALAIWVALEGAATPAAMAPQVSTWVLAAVVVTRALRLAEAMVPRGNSGALRMDLVVVAAAQEIVRLELGAGVENMVAVVAVVMQTRPLWEMAVVPMGLL